MVDFRTAEEKLQDFDVVLERVGVVISSASREAFELQRMQQVLWPGQYPQQSDEDFFNIAGAIQDLNDGGKIRERHLKRQPTLLDAAFGGGLISSIAHEVVSDTTVVVGSNKEYADLHQEGGTNRIPITDAAKEGLREFAEEEIEAAGADAVDLVFATAPRRAQIALSFSRRDAYEVKVNRRPFIPFGDFEDFDEILQDDIIFTVLDGLGAGDDL